MDAIKCLLPTMVLFLLMDLIWLGWVGKPLYLNAVGDIMRLQHGNLNARLLPAAIVYVLFALSIWFIVLPLAKGNLAAAFGYGALFGAMLYGIYDMTNLAVLEKWTWSIALIDWCWGIILLAITSGFCQWLATRGAA